MCVTHMSRLTRGLKSGSRDRVHALLSICSLQLHKGTLNTFVTLPGRTGIVWILTMVKATQDGRMGKRLQCIYISTFILQMGKLRSRGDLDLPKIKGKDLAGDKECQTQASGSREIQLTSLTMRYRGFHQIHLSHSC